MKWRRRRRAKAARRRERARRAAAAQASGTSVARVSSSGGGGRSGCENFDAGEAFIKLLQSPLVAELVAVAATAALAALAEHGFTSGGSDVAASAPARQ